MDPRQRHKEPEYGLTVEEVLRARVSPEIVSPEIRAWIAHELIHDLEYCDSDEEIAEHVAEVERRMVPLAAVAERAFRRVVSAVALAEPENGKEVPESPRRVGRVIP